MKKNHLKLKGISEDQFVFCHLINNSNLIHVVSVIMIRTVVLPKVYVQLNLHGILK